MSSLLDGWLRALVETPGLTALDLAAARVFLLGDSLRAAGIVAENDGPIADVGSGGGVPGIPLADAFPSREVVLIEAERRKCEFLERGTKFGFQYSGTICPSIFAGIYHSFI